jgi:hypothetical protein
MISLVDEMARPVREAVHRTAAGLTGDAQLAELFVPRVSGLGFDARGDARVRAAWAVVGQWLVAVSAGAIPANASLRDAEDWFYGSLKLPRLAPAVAPPAIGDVSESAVFALLPYVLDALRPGTRREVLRDTSAAPDRQTRKKLGVFYTPADVAERIVGLVSIDETDTCLDPTAGSGVFLRHAVMRGARPDSVFGCDLDPMAADVAAFVLAAAALRRGATTAGPPLCIWHLCRLNLATLDALSLRRTGRDASSSRAAEVGDIRERLRQGDLPAAPCSGVDFVNHELAELFPDLAGGAAVLVSNPPYARVARSLSEDESREYESLKGITASRTTRLEGLLVENLWRLTKPETGRGSLVLPLAVASSSRAEFRGLRRAIHERGGEWAFYFFDRTPDALFGDDVKTRNLIAVYAAAPTYTLSTTRLMRWTSRTRTGFLAGLTSTPVSANLLRPVPKLGSTREARTYETLRGLAGCLGDAALEARAVLPSKISSGRSEVVVAATAYNWLGTAREAAALVARGHTSENKLIGMRFADERFADAAYAILASRFSYWLWRVEGDGFHVTRNFLIDLPFSLAALEAPAISQLATAGRRLWAAALNQATASVNKGKTTISFPTIYTDELDRVDTVLLRAFGIEAAVDGCDVRGWHEDVVVVDFSEPRRRRALPPMRSVGASGNR